jgi:hypothetical protein
MKRRWAGHLAAQVVAAAFLALAGGVQAGVQAREYVCSLDVGGWQLCEKDGRVYLAPPGPGMRGRGMGQWYVSAPTVKDQKGRLLAADPRGRSPSVRLVRDRGDHAQWTFQITTLLLPRRYRGSGLKEGPSGIHFKLKMAGGPFKGWYLGAEAPPERRKEAKGREPRLRALKLVKDRRQAAVFTYVEVRYRVDHR